ncbi:MAG: hypothetical protein RR614_13315 [Eubacterium sp.]
MEQETILTLLEQLKKDPTWCEDEHLRAVIVSITGFNLIEY